MKVPEYPIVYTKCQEYDPYDPKANKLGLRSFWRADYKGQSIAWGDTKAECMKNAKNYLKGEGKG